MVNEEQIIELLQRYETEKVWRINQIVAIDEK